MKYYIDTCIWIDFIENRSAGLYPLGECAFQFFKKCRAHNYKVLYSTAVIWEMESQNHPFETILNEFNDILQKVEISKEIHMNAKIIAKQRALGFGDVLRALLSKENKSILITRDLHFYQLNDITKCRKPAELL